MSDLLHRACTALESHISTGPKKPYRRPYRKPYRKAYPVRKKVAFVTFGVTFPGPNVRSKDVGPQKQGICGIVKHSVVFYLVAALWKTQTQQCPWE